MRIYKWIPFCCGVLLLEFALVANIQGFSSGKCHLKPSIKMGANYYMLKTPWGKWLDMPCAPGTHFMEKKCGCGHIPSKQTSFLDAHSSTIGSRTPVSSRTTSTVNVGITRRAENLVLEKSTTNHKAGLLLNKILTTSDRSTSTRWSSKPTRTNRLSTAKTPISMGTKVKSHNSASTTTTKITSPPKIEINTDYSVPELHSSVEWLSPEAESKMASMDVTNPFFSTNTLNKVTTRTVQDTVPTRFTKASNNLNNVRRTPLGNTHSTSQFTKAFHNMDINSVSTVGQAQRKSHVTKPASHVNEIYSKPSLITKSSSAAPLVPDDRNTGIPTPADDDQGKERDEQEKFILSELSVLNDVTELISLPKSSTPRTTEKISSDQPKTTTTTVQQTQTTTKQTTQQPVTQNACELKAVPEDSTSYMGYVGDDVGWIQFQCPTGQEFSKDACWCIDSSVGDGQSGTSFIPPDCQYFKEGRTSFKEYVDFLQSWVYSDCADGYEFSQLKCGCVLAGTLPETEKQAEKNSPDDTKTTAAPKTTVKVPNGCLNIAEGTNSFKTYVENLGVWVYSDCPSGAYFDQASCGCITPEEKARNECPYRKYGKSSYTHYIPDLGDNVYYQCPDNHVFDEVFCMCIAKGSSKLKHIITNKARDPVTSSTKQQEMVTEKVPENCKKIADSRTSYKEYMDQLGDWVYSDCGMGEVFVQARCGCFQGDNTNTGPGTARPPSTDDDKANECEKKATGKSSFKTFVKQINDWVYSECPTNQVFNQTQCKCIVEAKSMHSQDQQPSSQRLIQSSSNSSSVVDSNHTVHNHDTVHDVHNSQSSRRHNKTSPGSAVENEAGENDDGFVDDGRSPKNLPNASSLIVPHARLVKILNSTEEDRGIENGPACGSIQTGKTSFKTFVPDLNDWVFADCPDYQVYDPSLCQCVPEGGNVNPQDRTPAPVTTPSNTVQPTNPNCQYQKRGAGYGKYVSQLGEWVYYECPSGQVFDIASCNCQESRDSGFSSDCEYQRAEDGQYRKYVKQLNQWIYYQCPTDQSFDEGPCQCSAEAKDVATNAPVTKTPAPGTKCLSKPSNMGKEYFIISFPSFGDILYTCDFGYSYSQKECGCVADQTTVQKTTKQTFINPKCALQSSDKGPGYFRMQLTETQWVDLACPANERFSLDKCSCSPA